MNKSKLLLLTLFIILATSIAHAQNLTSAEHLDTGKSFLAEYVNESLIYDGTVTGNISDGEYIRFVFDQVIGSDRQIFIVARGLTNISSTSIELYGNGDLLGNNTLSGNISLRLTYDLDNLSGTNDTFEFKFVGDTVLVDYIADPDPINITNCTGLQNINSALAWDYQLINDIDCSGVSWSPIGTYSSAPFTGTLDGQEYTINNFNLTGSANYYGMFEYTNGATIENINIASPIVDISGTNIYHGTLVGIAQSSTITNIHITDLDLDGYRYTGGLMGYISACTVRSSSVTGTVDCDKTCGGFVGKAIGSDVRYSYVEANVTGDDDMGLFYGETDQATQYTAECYARGVLDTTGQGYDQIGGFVGEAWNGDFHNCFVDATMQNLDSQRRGGFVGQTVDGGVAITNTYSTSSGNLGAGRCFVGMNQYSNDMSTAYYDSTLCTVGETSNVNARTTAQMKNSSTFSGWDFDTVWGISATYNDGYPYLRNCVPAVYPDAAEYSGETTDFLSIPDLTNAANIVLQRGSSKVRWVNNLNVENADYDTYSEFGDGFVSFDLANLHSSHNSEANVTLNLTAIGQSCSDFGLYYASSFYTTRSDIVTNGAKVASHLNNGSDCTDDTICTNVACAGGILTFTAKHFDGFGGGELPPVNCGGATCEIWAQVGINNSNPEISSVTVPGAVTLLAGTTKDVYIQFNASDNNTASDLNQSTASIVLSKSGESSRSSSSCTQLSNSTLWMNFNCTITMYYYDGAGQWIINATIFDNQVGSAYDDTNNLTVNSLDSISLTVSTISFGQIGPGTSDVAGTVEVINNTGNTDYTQIQVTGYNLTSGSENIDISNFCGNDINDANTGCDTLSDGGAVTITDASLSKGASATESIYTFVDLPSALVDGQYTSSSSWIMTAS